MTENERVLPYGREEDWQIAFVDVETTGLLAGYHEMIDIGIVMTNLEGLEIDSFFRRIMPEYPHRAEQEAIRCNGFSVERWTDFGAAPPKQAVVDIIQFYKDAAGFGMEMTACPLIPGKNKIFSPKLKAWLLLVLELWQWLTGSYCQGKIRKAVARWRET